MALRTAVATAERPAARAPRLTSERAACCGLFHRAVELVGKRWTGAILSVLLEGSLRFSEIRALVPDISDRLLSERLKELEAEGIVDREVLDEHPIGVEYRLTAKGEALAPAVAALKSWAGDWLCA
ncbi:MAG: helix-turn-helix transcriptional regulator [Thermoleophilaceae bacterium]|nr:helix-turn-helix transcriptional regulator [Thermoleophilaceae bacterium]